MRLNMKPLRHPVFHQFVPRQRSCRRIPHTIPLRRFITPPTQAITASRTLPYPGPAIYSIIADVPSYSGFLPYCKKSTVTRWSNADSTGQKWPEEAQLVVGWGGIEETFTSKIYCVPGKIVEAVGGRSQTSLKGEEIGHHTHAPTSEPTTNGSNKPSPMSSISNPLAALSSLSSISSQDTRDSILTHLMTRWTVRPFPYQPPPLRSSPLEGTTGLPHKEHTEVSLTIEFQFANPIYSAMSAAVTDKVAGVMIEAFEKRVKFVLEGGVDGTRERSRMDVVGRESP